MFDTMELVSKERHYNATPRAIELKHRQYIKHKQSTKEYTAMDKQQLIKDGWKIERRFHEEEARYYFTATKGRNILTSDDGKTFNGLLNGEWV